VNDALPTSTEPGAGAGQFLGEFSDYPGLLIALRQRAKERKIAVSSEEVAEVSGLPIRYVAKVLQANPTRRLGMISLGPVLAILGCRLALLEDTAALERFGARLKQRNDNLIHHDGVVSVLTERRWRQTQAKGRRNRWAKLTPKQRAAWARKMNRLRWRKARAAARAADAERAPSRL
jgi:hypothetical protein